jgi:oligoribonuclease NrnB/cAMP/cGMP phosphodiesterase (DHH superfamily)
MLRILNITHDDLDGNAAGVAIRLAHPNDHVRTIPVGVHQVAFKLLRELETRKYDIVILSDCSIKIPGDRCNSETRFEGELSEYEVINYALPEALTNFVESGGRFIVLDHHPTAVPMAEFYHDTLDEGSILETHDSEGTPRAGSELAGRYFLDNCPNITKDYQEAVIDLMRLCGDVDCWRDPLGLAGDLGLAGELLHDSYSFMEYLNWCIEEKTIRNGLTWSQVFNSHPVLSYYMRLAKNELTGAIATARKSMVEYSNNVVVVEAGKYVSLVSHAIYTETGGIVALVTQDKPKISFRCHEDVKVHLGLFCKKYGGGGHKNAAGMGIPSDQTLDTIIAEMVKYAEQG